MNKQELIERIEAVPAHNTRTRPWIDKRVVLDLIRLLDEPQPVKVPQCVADWIEKCKTFEHFVVSLSFALRPIAWEGNNLSDKCINWLMDANNQETFARAWLDGYEVEEEKRYFVKAKSIGDHNNYLKYNTNQKHWYFGSRFIYVNDVDTKIHHTRKELEEANFGWVFDCPGIEIEEVEYGE